MFIIWGSRSILLTIGSGTFFCPQCGTTQDFRHRRYIRFFTIYFIPLIPFKNGQDFVECKHCKTKFNASVLSVSANNLSVSPAYKTHHPLLTALLVIGLLMFACVAFSGITAENERQERAQAQAAVESTKTALIANYGADNFKLCESATTVDSWSLGPQAHVLVLNKDTQDILTDFQQAFPKAMQATSKQNLSHVLCISTTYKEYAHDDYGDLSKDATTYTCTRYRRYTEAFLVDTATGGTVGHQVFRGPLPPECPDKTSHNLSVYGDDPTPADIIGSLSQDVGT